MTTGVLIFAFNNEHIDYLAMANWSAKNIRRHLKLPVAVVTDRDIPENYFFDRVIKATPVGGHTRKFVDQDENVTWYNGNRVDAYNLSPWDRTLLLDADYVVASDKLLTLLDINENFIAHKTAYDVAYQENFDELNNFGEHNMPMWWATVILFKRSYEAESIFECMNMIRNNWDHYRKLYKINKPTYRNDFALSIALGIVNGHTLKYIDIPWKLASVTPAHTLKQLDDDTYRVDFLTQEQKPRWIVLQQDFHAMCKKHLGDIIASS